MPIFIYNNVSGSGGGGGTPSIPEEYVTKTTADQTYYVDPTSGSNTTGNGEYSSPYKDITYIFENVLPDVITNQIDIIIKGTYHNLTAPILKPIKKIFKDNGYINIYGENGSGSCSTDLYSTTTLNMDTQNWTDSCLSIFYLSYLIGFRVSIYSLNLTYSNSDSAVISAPVLFYINSSQINIGDLYIGLDRNAGNYSWSSINNLRATGLFLYNKSVVLLLDSLSTTRICNNYSDSNNYGYSGSISEVQGDYSSKLFLSGLHTGITISYGSYLLEKDAGNNNCSRSIVLYNNLMYGLYMSYFSSINVNKLILYNNGYFFDHYMNNGNTSYGIVISHNSAAVIPYGCVIHINNSSSSSNGYCLDIYYMSRFYGSNTHPPQLQLSNQVNIKQYYIYHFGQIIYVTYGGSETYSLAEFYEVLRSPVSSISWTYLKGA